MLPPLESMILRGIVYLLNWIKMVIGWVLFNQQVQMSISTLEIAQVQMSVREAPIQFTGVECTTPPTLNRLVSSMSNLTWLIQNGLPFSE